MPCDEFLTFMFSDWNIFSMLEKKKTFHNEKSNINIATGKHPSSFLSRSWYFQTLSKYTYSKYL